MQLGYIILGVPSAVFGGALIVAPMVPTTGLTEDQLAELRRFAADHNAHRAASVRPA